MLGYGEMVADELAETDRSDLLADVEKIRAAGRRLLALVDERLHLEVIGGPVLLPQKASAPRTEKIQTLPPSETGEDGGLLLIVDDNEENRDVLARRLEKQGHWAVTAGSGPEALRALAEQPFDLVLLDIMMPEMDGYEVLFRIKSEPSTQNLPVIMISALDELESVVRCIEMGAADYLPKPFNPTLLKARVGASLREKRAHDRERRYTDEIAESYRRLRELERLRDDLTYMIVHDLRTPLTSLLTGLQTVPLVGDLNETQDEMLQIATDGGEILLGMINDLLDVEKMEQESVPLERTLISPETLISQAIAQVTLLAAAEELTLTPEIAPNTPNFTGDEDKLRRTLVNLMGNAIKFTPRGGVVTAGVSCGPENSLLFFVRDTGEGIPADALDRVFEKFGQVETRQAGRKMSTGLGLTFCKLAVEAHGGRIWAESAPGAGSVFFFTLPSGTA